MDKPIIWLSVGVFVACFAGTFAFIMLRSKKEIKEGAFHEKSVMTEVTFSELKPWFLQNGAADDVFVVMNREAVARSMPKLLDQNGNYLVQLIMDKDQTTVKKTRLVEYVTLGAELAETLNKGNGTMVITQ